MTIPAAFRIRLLTLGIQGTEGKKIKNDDNKMDKYTIRKRGSDETEFECDLLKKTTKGSSTNK